MYKIYDILQKKNNNIITDIKSTFKDIDIYYEYINKPQQSNDIINKINLNKLDNIDDDTNIKRIVITSFVLTTIEERSNFKGLIVDIIKRKIVCFGTDQLYEIDDDHFNDIDCNDYNIYKIFDGTIINLYYYDDKWTIGTSKSYNINNFIWAGNHYSYDNLIIHLLLIHGIQISSLIKTITYTFGFTFPEYHPYNNESKIWFISAMQTQNHTRIYYNDLVTYNGIIYNFPKQELIKKISINDIINIKNKSVNACILNNNCFGIIMKHKINGTPIYIIKSKLFIELNKLLYNNNQELTRKYSKHLITIDNSIEYINLKYNNRDRYNLIIFDAYFNKDKKEILINLFPQYINKLKKLDKIYKNIIDQVIKTYNNDKKIQQSKLTQLIISIIKTNSITNRLTNIPDIINTNMMIRTCIFNNIIF